MTPPSPTLARRSPILAGIVKRLEAIESRLPRKPYSILHVRSDAGGWVLDEEALALARIADRLGIKSVINRGLSAKAPQCCHYTSQFVLREHQHFSTKHRISVDYFHGDPHGDAVFAENYMGLQRHHPAITRLRVSHSGMETVALEAGVPREKVHRIPIGVDLPRFPLVTATSRMAARRHLRIPESAIVVGSFQKDGMGWGEGLEPKLIKGPDLLVAALCAAKTRVPEIHVLLTGPARGYVRRGLEKGGIPFFHVTPNRYDDISSCFHALDAYVIASRDEGGPKALLEAMASGIPVATTRVGQAIDLVLPNGNAWMVEREDVEGLAEGLVRILLDSQCRARVIAGGRITAEANSHDAQTDAWATFFAGYVEP